MESQLVPTPTDVVEALLFASDTPLEAERISEVLDLGDVGEARRLIDELRARYDASTQGLQARISIALGFACRRRLPRGVHLKCFTALVT